MKKPSHPYLNANRVFYHKMDGLNDLIESIQTHSAPISTLDLENDREWFGAGSLKEAVK